MEIRRVFCLLCLISFSLFSKESLPDKYLIAYGNPDAKTKVVEYFSFACPQCIRLFKEEFNEIQKIYVETKQTQWIFHPYPMDLLTVQAMVCLGKLNDKEKQMFLEAFLPECEGIDGKVGVALLKKAMELLKKPVPDLSSPEFLEKTEAFVAAYRFLSKTPIQDVPTVDINGVNFKQMPDKKFIDSKIKNITFKSSLGGKK